MLTAIDFRELAVAAGGVFFFGFGLLLRRAYLHAREEDHKFAQSAVKVPAEVIEILQEEARGSSTNPYWYRPVLQFKDAAGREHTAKVTTGRGASSWKVGDQLMIWYSPDYPEKARLDDEWSLGGATSGIAFGSFVFLAIGLAMIIWFGSRIFR
jgi:hypothetical protein